MPTSISLKTNMIMKELVIISHYTSQWNVKVMLSPRCLWTMSSLWIVTKTYDGPNTYDGTPKPIIDSIDIEIVSNL